MTMFGNKDNKIIRGITENPTDKSKEVVNIVRIAWLNLIFIWKATNTPWEMVKDIKAINWWLDSAGWIFWTIIINIIALIFVWMAFMAAKSISKVAETAFQPFEDMWKKIWEMAMSGPKYIPIPGTNWQSAASLQRTVELGVNKIQEEKLKNTTEKAWKLVPWAVKWIIQPEDRTAIADAIKKWISQSTADEKVSTIGSATWSAISKWAEFRWDNFEVIAKSWQEVLKWVNDKGKIETTLRNQGFDEMDIRATMKMINWDKLERVEEERIWKAIQTKYGTAWWSNWTATNGFTATENVNASWQTSWVKVTMWDTIITISDNKISAEDKKKMLESLKWKFTEAEFSKKMEWLHDSIKTIIKWAIESDDDFYKKPTWGWTSS